MAQNIAEAFKILRSNIEITDLQAEVVSTRQNNVRDLISSELEVKESFLSGSYSRHTLLGPLSDADIDIFIVLDSKYFHQYNGQNGGPSGLLELVKKVLRKTYTRTPDISRNGQAVTIQFTDFMVDVVPSFYRKDGGFLIPNSITQSWLPTDPKKHVEIMTAANEAHDGDLVPLVKMIKAWNRYHESYFRSFHLETMALSLLANVKISDFPSGMRYFFDKGKSFVAQKNPDPAGFQEDIGAYINSQEKVNEAVSRFSSACNFALRAEQSATNGALENAFNEWKRIFGDYFPAYS